MLISHTIDGTEYAFTVETYGTGFRAFLPMNGQGGLEIHTTEIHRSRDGAALEMVNIIECIHE